MARQFARLKLRLIRNGLRAPQYAVLFTMGATGSAILALIGFFFLAGLRADRVQDNATIVVFGMITLVWTIVPLLGFGTDETLDPQRLALLPLGQSELLRGLLVAALVGVAPVATAFALSGSIIGLAHGAMSVFLVGVAIAATLLLCVTASRTLIALLSPLLRSRRCRDVMIMVITLAVLVPQSFRLFSATARYADFRHELASVADRVRYTPFGLGGLAATEAGKGHIMNSLAAIGAILVMVAVLLFLWARAIPRAMTSADTAAPARTIARGPHDDLPLFSGALGFLPRDRAGAIAAKELRYYLRDPRRRTPLIAALLLPALFMLSTFRGAAAHPRATTLLALVSLLPASGLTLNQFGLDGAALWSTIVTGNQVDADLTGKNVATAIVVAPVILLPAIVIASITHGWSYLPITIGLAPGLLGVILAIGNIVSAWAPYALPDRRNPLAANPGQGCVGFVAAMGALLVDVIVLAPVGILVALALAHLSLALATVVSVAAASAYGYGVWRVGRGLATRHLRWTMPELLLAVSPRQAG